MAIKLLNVAKEAIAFQDGNLFSKLNKCIEDIRKAQKSNKNYKPTEALESLRVLIFKETNISLKFDNGGPAVMLPFINKNHIFFDKELFQALEAYQVFGDEQMRQLLKKRKNAMSVKGSVDLKNSKVDGVYSEITCDMYLPPYFFTNTHFSVEEAAAVILHELGHVFTTFEFVTRFTSTNFALEVLSRAYDNAKTEEQKEAIFISFKNEGYLKARQADILKETKSKEDALIVFFDSQIENTISDLGASVYDVNGCEYLADQFATRHGAGVHLTTALTKYVPTEGRTPLTYIISLAVFAVVGSVAGVVGTLLFFVLGILVEDKRNDIYDNMYSRLNRIKHQIIQKIKEGQVPNKDLPTILKGIEVIEANMLKYKDDLDYMSKLAYIFRPSYRAAHNQEKLQKFLENMAYNPLFIEHKKLGMV